MIQHKLERTDQQQQLDINQKRNHLPIKRLNKLNLNKIPLTVEPEMTILNAVNIVGNREMADQRELTNWNLVKSLQGRS